MLADYLVPCKYRAVYMAVTNDKYELPIAVADGMWEIARAMGVDPACVFRHVHGMVKGKYKIPCKFVKVYVEDDSRDENKSGNLPG